MNLRIILLIGVLCSDAMLPTLASAQTEIRPVVVRPAREHPNCQIYLKADGSRLLFKDKPISAGGSCPSDYLPGTVTRFGANSYRLRVSGNDCIITAAGLGQCR